MRSSRKNKFRLLQFPAADVGAIHFKLTTFSYFFFRKKKSKAIWKARAPFVQIGAWPVQSHFRRLGRVPAAVDNISTRFIHWLVWSGSAPLTPKRIIENSAAMRTLGRPIRPFPATTEFFFLRSTRLDVQHIGTLCMSESGPCGALNEATSGGRAAAIICKMSLLVCSFFSLRLQGWTR